jgi:6-phosphogluconolactonase
LPAKIKLADDPNAIARIFALDFSRLVDDSSGPVHIALSGGSTPIALYQLWAGEFRTRIDWHRVHFYWGDERCVPPDDDDSNYGAAKRILLHRIGMPGVNINRIEGESEPHQERERYEARLSSSLPFENGWPQFTLILLGIGIDGHVASIFPYELQTMMQSPRICEVATHPESGQQRITLTGNVLNNAAHVAFMATGKNKAEILRDIINRKGDWQRYPAAYVQPKGDLCFYLDRAAASMLGDRVCD